MTYQTFDQSVSVLSKTPISYCLAEKARQHCRISFSMRLMSGVIACNILKIICMGYMVWRLDTCPLVTLGDALASFLERPGEYRAFPYSLIHRANCFIKICEQLVTVTLIFEAVIEFDS